ncbi:MAG: glycerate 2-kinase [Candidatus Atribacteria bacterium]|nr:glycerate 2-kinase [Candidatus Atribacteria bacterium]
MKILLCPDSFKGSLFSWEVSQAMREGLESNTFSGWQIVEKPLADGGEGTVEAVVRGAGGKIIEREVTGPLGKKVKAQIGILPDLGVAVLEMAQAAGLLQIPPSQANPRYTTTYGVGELLKEAYKLGYRKIVLGIGGSATCDGGMGVLQALGVRFLDERGEELAGIGDNLSRIARIDRSGLQPLGGAEILIACDVENPLYGPEGAAYVYAPQKGASPKDVAWLDQGLRHYAWMVEESSGIKVDQLSGGGAAGGIGAGMFAFLGARLVSGIKLIMDLLNLEEEIKTSDWIVSGEGKVDKQTFYGKVVAGVWESCKRYRKPLVVVAGMLDPQVFPLLLEKRVPAFSIANGPITPAEAMKEAHLLVKQWAVSFGLTIGGVFPDGNQN